MDSAQISASITSGSITREYISRGFRDRYRKIESIGYYVHDEVTLLDATTRTYSWSHWDGHEKFIDDLFLTLDPQINLDFFRAKNPNQAQIEIYRVSPDSPYVQDDGILGLGIDSRSLYDMGFSLNPAKGFGAYHLAFWASADGDDSPFAENYDVAKYSALSTIIHEIGHILGLSHPQSGGRDDPAGLWHDNQDTVMSYNENPVNVNAYFAAAPFWTSSDIRALQSLWGLEDDSDDSLTGIRRHDMVAGVNDIFAFKGIDEIALAPVSGTSNIVRVHGFDAEIDYMVVDRQNFRSPTSNSVYIAPKAPISPVGATKIQVKAHKKAVEAHAKMLKKIGRTADSFAYNSQSGELFYDSNNLKKGFGESGGLIAVFDGAPLLSGDDFFFA